MINDDFDFTIDSSVFPVSIEEFAAYVDGNLSDDEMQRVSSVIDNDEMMQGVMDSMEQSELTLAEYGQEDMQLPEEIADGEFEVPETDNHYAGGGGGFFNPFAKVAACAASPIILNQAFMLNEEDFSEAPNNYFEEADNSSDNELANHCDINDDNPIND